jgi:hypothetical protein
VEPEREVLFARFEAAVRAFGEAAERAKGLTGADLYLAMLRADRLYLEVQRAEWALIQYDRQLHPAAR